jgi:hypothetical protein
MTLDATRQEFRVIKLFGSHDHDSALKADMFVTSFDRKPTYKALSYTWGGSGLTSRITLSGHPLAITNNLEEALRMIRRPAEDMVVWVDAVCINQADNAERTQQVQLMRQIYQSADEVIAWLGTVYGVNWRGLWSEELLVWHGDQRDAATVDAIMRNLEKSPMDFMTAFATGNPIVVCFCLLRMLAGDVHLDEIRFLGDSGVSGLLSAALTQLAMAPWWTRMWVVQEAVVADKVTLMYDRVVMPFRILEAGARYFSKHDATCCSRLAEYSMVLQGLKVVSQHVQDFGTARDMHHQKTPTNLGSLVTLFSTREATDPRDKIYSLLGLVSDWGGEPSLLPDYTKTNSCVYEDAALRIMRTSPQPLSLLSHRLPDTHLPLDPTLPSWVPNWHTAAQSPFWSLLPANPDAPKRNHPSPTLFNTGSGTTADTRPFSPGYATIPGSDAPAKRVLCVRGVRIGSVVRTLQYFQDRQSVREKIAKMLYPPPERGEDEYPYPLDGGYLPAAVAAGSDTTINPVVMTITSDAGVTTATSACTVREALLHTICAGVFPDKPPEPGSRDAEPTYRRATASDVASVAAWVDWAARQCHSRSPPPPTGVEDGTTVPPPLRDADTAVMAACIAHRVFVTDTGHVGIANMQEPLSVGSRQTATDVHVLAGGAKPFLLAPGGEMQVEGLEEMRSVSRFGGDCYIHGLMDGIGAGQGEEIYLV